MLFCVRYRCLRGATDLLALAVCYLFLVRLQQVEDEVVELTEVMDGVWPWSLGTTSAALKTSDPFEDEGGEVVVVHAADTLTEVIYTHSPSMLLEPVKRGRKEHKGLLKISKDAPGNSLFSYGPVCILSLSPLCDLMTTIYMLLMMLKIKNQKLCVSFTIFVLLL